MRFPPSSAAHACPWGVGRCYLPLLWQGARVHLGLAEPPTSSPSTVWVLTFLSFSFVELGVGVHVSSALHPLLRGNWVPLGRKSGWILIWRRLLTRPGLKSGLSDPAAGLSGFLEACFFPQELTFAKGSEGGGSFES